jgi:hypothetical protein
MNSKATIVADATTGTVICQSANPQFGYVKVQQQKTLIDNDGFLKSKMISALIPGTMGDLLLADFKAGQVLNGNIVIIESLTPFNKKDPDRDLKVAGDTGIVCSLNGQPIYRKTKFSFNANAEDTLIMHDNVDELRLAYAVNESAVQPNEDFSI